MTTEASLVALNEALPSPVGMDRFRPNIVIGGTEPFAEVCIFYTSLSLFNSFLYLTWTDSRELFLKLIFD